MERNIDMFVGTGLGLGVGAGLMYFLDPNMGRRRRALLRDQMVGATSRLDDCLDATWRDVRHRAQGIASESAGLFRRDEASDQVLVDRVRSKIGRKVSHPGSIEVTAHEGRVTLRGPVLAHELNDMLSIVHSVRGVADVENQLEVHKQPGDIPGLQGGQYRRSEPAWDMLQQNWAPATRLFAGALGTGLIANCITRRTPSAALLGTAGLGLLLRGAINADFGRLFGVTGGRRAIDVNKTITILAPPEQVFPFFAKYDAFPRFMSHIREVRDLGDGRSHWVAAGPAGISLSWDATVTQFVPKQLLAWRSEPGAAVANVGMIRFEATPEGNTRVSIRLSYNPPGGALGHYAARLFGADAKGLMDEDLVRLKGLIEEGETSAPQKGKVSQEDVAIEATSQR